MVGAYRRYVALSAADRRLVREAALLMAVVRICLGRRSLLDVRRFLSWCTTRWPHADPPGPAAALRIQWAVAAAGRRMPGGTCLVQALTADALLQRRRLPSEVCLVVRKGAAGETPFEAHAWVVSHGVVITGGQDGSRFFLLSRLESPASP